jgi:hypothetical protein
MTLAPVAQLVEQRIRNAWVGGSSPFWGTSASVAQWLEQSAHNALVVGSSPTRRTIISYHQHLSPRSSREEKRAFRVFDLILDRESMEA